MRFLAARLLAASCLAALIVAAPATAKPADFARLLSDPGRSAEARALDEGRMPAEVLDFAGFAPGAVVADYFAGNGYYTELLAGAVGPRGRVYAMVPPGGYKAEQWDRLRARHANVLPLVAPAQAMALAPASLDGIFTHLVYHDLYFVSERFQHPRLDVDAVLANWFAAVRPGGHVVIIDHAGPAGDTRAVVDRLHRIDPETVKADMTRAGFVLEAESSVLHRSEDRHELGVFDPSVRGKTDRFVLKFKRP